MTKVNNPLLGFKAHGSLANTLTFQDRNRGTIARKKPIPTDPRTDPQIWHRHLYLVLCQYWNGLSNAQKRTWESNARRLHITGFNLFMRTQLNKLDNLMLYLPLNEGSGAAAIDFSNHLNHGVIYGASWTDGEFGKALRLDGIDDYLAIPHSPTLNITNQLTITFRVKWEGAPSGVSPAIINKRIAFDSNYTIGSILLTREIVFAHNPGGAGWDGVNSGLFIKDNDWSFVGVAIEDNTVFFRVDDATVTKTKTAAFVTNNAPLWIGKSPVPRAFKGIIDEVNIRNDTLTPADLLLRYNREESS